MHPFLLHDENFYFQHWNVSSLMRLSWLWQETCANDRHKRRAERSSSFPWMKQQVSQPVGGAFCFTLENLLLVAPLLPLKPLRLRARLDGASFPLQRAEQEESAPVFLLFLLYVWSWPVICWLSSMCSAVPCLNYTLGSISLLSNAAHSVPTQVIHLFSFLLCTMLFGTFMVQLQVGNIYLGKKVWCHIMWT